MKLLFSLLMVLLTFSSCSKDKEEITIGFVAGFTGKYSSLGVSVRDGFLLKFDEIGNKINGHKVNIILKDDAQDKIKAKKIIEEFIKKDIKLIIGHTTSSMTEVSFPIVNKQKETLLISPTASSDAFSKQDDNFLRVQVDHSEKRYMHLVDYLLKNNYKKIFMIYDSKNASHVNGYENILQKLFISKGGEPYLGKIDINEGYEKIAKKVKQSDFDILLVVANAIDASNVIQYLRLNDMKKPILSSGWARTLDFIRNGGKSVEGVLFSTEYEDNSKDKKFLEFVKKYKEKYNQVPAVFAGQGYELASILIKNLKESTSLDNLKERIIAKKLYKGLQGDIIFDKYGDIYREYFMMKIENRKFVKIK